jgi:MFS superfamily sulfate permease-like transporter
MMLILKEISLLFKVMVAIPSPHYLGFNHIQLGSVVITVVSLIILIAWDKVPFKEIKINGALIAVISGIVLNEIFILSGSSLAISNAPCYVTCTTYY